MLKKKKKKKKIKMKKLDPKIKKIENEHQREL